MIFFLGVTNLELRTAIKSINHMKTLNLKFDLFSTALHTLMSKYSSW